MPNQNYIKGVKKERKIVNQYKADGCVAFRSAGSHSPIDVCVIDHAHHLIRLIQSKPDDMSVSAKSKLYAELSSLAGVYSVVVDVV